MNPVAVNVGHTVNMSIVYLDQNGNPMVTTPTPDSAPAWTDAPSAAGVDTLTVAPGGLTASLAALAVGSDVVSLEVVVGGVTFNATLPVTISAAPQVLTSVQIAATVV